MFDRHSEKICKNCNISLKLKKIKELYQLYELNISKKNLEELLNDLLIYVYKLYENEVDYMYDCLNNIYRELHRKKSLKRKKIKIKHFRVQTF